MLLAVVARFSRSRGTPTNRHDEVSNRREVFAVVNPWGYTAGHAWRYDANGIPGGMEVRFHDHSEAIEAGFCGCDCGVCKPESPHREEEGCICSLLGCFCFVKSA